MDHLEALIVMVSDGREMNCFCTKMNCRIATAIMLPFFLRSVAAAITAADGVYANRANRSGVPRA
jgi:hypothetical protein